MPNTTSRCFYITDIADIRPDGDCIRAELVDDIGKIVLRGSRHTLTKALGLGTDALRKTPHCDVVSFPKHT